MRIIFVVIISIDVCQDFEQVPAGELHITRWWSRRIRYLDSFLSLLITNFSSDFFLTLYKEKWIKCVSLFREWLETIFLFNLFNFFERVSEWWKLDINLEEISTYYLFSFHSFSHSFDAFFEFFYIFLSGQTSHITEKFR